MQLPFGYILKADFSGGFLAFAGLFLFLTVLIFYMNRRRVVRQGSITLYNYLLIIGARILISLLLLLLFFNPDIELQRTQILSKRVAIIVDRSMSMTKAWEGSEAEISEAIKDFLARTEEAYELDLWSMNGDLMPSDEIEYADEFTAFEWFPGIQGMNADRYKAVMLLSDGQLNQGRSPLDMPWTSTIPIYPVLPLNPYSNQSLLLTDLVYTIPEKKGDPVLLTLRIQQEGLIGEQLAINVSDEVGQQLEGTSKRVDQMIMDIVVPVKLQLGVKRSLTVEITAEGTEINTQRSILVSTEDDRLRILLASERPDLQYKFLVQSFPDSLYRLHTLLGSKGVEPTVLDMDEIDLIILNEPGPRVLERLGEGSIIANKDTHKPIIIFFSGDEELTRDWQELLKVNQESVDWQGEFPVGWEDDALDHSLYIGARGSGFEPLELEQFPPVKRNINVIHEDGPNLMGVQPGQMSGTVLTLSPDGSRAYFNGGGLWKWFFQPETRDSFKDFWNYLLKYLVSLSDFKPVTLEINSLDGETGDYIPVNIVVKDVDGIPIFSEINLWQEDGSGKKTPLSVERHQTGSYTGQVNSRMAGSFSIIAEAHRFGELWGRDTSRIDLMAFNEEGQSEGVDRVFLQRLAEHSDGGRVISTTDNLPIFPDKSFEKKTSIHLKGLRSASIFYLIIFLMLVEWTLRRRNGLL